MDKGLLYKQMSELVWVKYKNAWDFKVSRESVRFQANEWDSRLI